MVDRVTVVRFGISGPFPYQQRNVMARALLIRLLAGSAAATSVVGLAATAHATPAPTSGGSATESVIVVLRDQLSTQPANRAHVSARKAAARNDQDAVLARLAGSTPTNVVNYTVGNAFSATVTAAQAAQLAADPAVASVVPNRKVQVSPPSSTPAVPAATPRASTAAGDPSPVDPAACSTDRSKPQLEPEALQTLHVRSDDPTTKTAAALGIDGTGVKVAYIADGINPNNIAFLRPDGSSAVVDYKDFYGDGPSAVTSGAEAFGDASAIAAQGATYDVADFANPSVVSFPSGHCYIKIVGVAPGASIVALKAGSELLPNSAILQAIDYAVTTAKVDVINESFGANIYPDSGARNTIQLFDDNAVKAGVTVVASTGDAGITGTVGNPATDPLVISAGASTDSRLYEQTGYALATRFGNGRWLDSNTSALSSAGITGSGRTIDVEAPGEADWAACDSSGRFTGCTSFGNPNHHYTDIQAFGGTSQASPLTAGVAALVIQAYRTTHSGSPAPAVVKQIITSTARDLDLPGEQQGSGLIDARAAVEAALTWPGATSAAPAGVGPNVALSANQVTLAGAPGSTQQASVTVTNVSNSPVSIATGTRRYAQLSQATQQVKLDTTSSQTLPYPTSGAPWVYQKVSFTVPSGADELSAVIRWPSGATYGGAGPVVRLSLFTPDGTYAANTRPQGGPVSANFGTVTVRRPAPGTWTGVLYTPASAGGYTGTVGLQTEAFRAVPVGTVSPSTASIQPGQSATVTGTFTVPSVGGDTVDMISIGNSGGHQVAVPVVVRSLIPVGRRPGTFAGTITGGNARAYSPAQTFSYAFDVPRGQRDVQVGVTMSKDPQDLLEGILIDPHDEVQSINSNQSVDAAGKTTQGLSLQNTAAAPIAGRWRYVIVVQDPVSGLEFTNGFTGTVTLNAVGVTGTLPTRLKAGHAVTRTIRITNHGRVPMLVQTDARTGAAQALQLAPQFAGSTLSLPQSVDDLSQIPSYLVAPDTTGFSLSASSTVPAQVELNSPGGGIDLFGDLQAAKGGDTISTASVAETAGQVGLGYWGTYVQEIGPFGDGGAPAGTSVLTATATMRPFDSTVTTSTGDPYLASVDPTAPSGQPIVIAPGKTGTVTVTITPTARVGAKVSGVLHLVTTPIGVAGVFNTTGEVLATVPYSYTVTK